MDFKKAATEIVDGVSSLAGGPISTKDDAVRFAEAALREAYEIGRCNYHNQLTDNMSPRKSNT